MYFYVLQYYIYNNQITYGIYLNKIYFSIIETMKNIYKISDSRIRTYSNSYYY